MTHYAPAVLGMTHYAPAVLGMTHYAPLLAFSGRAKAAPLSITTNVGRHPEPR
jgi:hypothetical protein